MHSTQLAVKVFVDPNRFFVRRLISPTSSLDNHNGRRAIGALLRVRLANKKHFIAMNNLTDIGYGIITTGNNRFAMSLAFCREVGLMPKERFGHHEG
jgi:hypothetical protein